MRSMRLLLPLLLASLTSPALAEGTPGYAEPWQMVLQTPVTPVMQRLYDLHSGLLILITVITLFVLALLTYVCIRFSAKNNPVPSRTTHNTLVEIVWTSVPILILIAIAIPSLRDHYFMDRAVDAKMTLKVTGYQWYWGYEYPDQAGVNFESHIFPNAQDTSRKATVEDDNKLLAGEPRLLTVDNPAVVPVNTVVRVLITGNDVIHSWSVPAFGVKLDAIPGRINETWFKATQIGTYRGQCSQLCGVWHGFMPVVVKVVSQDDFNTWVAAQQKAQNITPPQAAGASAQPAAETAPVPAKKVPAGVSATTKEPAGEAAKKN